MKPFEMNAPMLLLTYRLPSVEQSAWAHREQVHYIAPSSRMDGLDVNADIEHRVRLLPTEGSTSSSYGNGRNHRNFQTPRVRVVYRVWGSLWRRPWRSGARSLRRSHRARSSRSSTRTTSGTTTARRATARATRRTLASRSSQLRLEWYDL